MDCYAKQTPRPADRPLGNRVLGRRPGPLRYGTSDRQLRQGTHLDNREAERSGPRRTTGEVLEGEMFSTPLIMTLEAS